MKLLLATTLVALCAIYVFGERCVGPMDCTLTLCANGSQLICERQECTCAPLPKSCQTRDDCRTGDRCPIRGQDWHCIDNVCRCTY